VFTRCPACHTVHPVNAALLARAGGKYRCGKCQKVGNALEALFDTWPEASEPGAALGGIPELGGLLAVDAVQSSGEPEAGEAGPEIVSPAWSPTRKYLLRGAWITAAVAMLVVIALDLANFFQQPLLDRARVESTLIRLGIREAPPEKPFRDPERIELVSREMRPHPLRPNVLLLTATIVNRASRSQPYPDIDVSLLDSRGRKLTHQLFSPGDYLKRSSELRSGMAPDAYLTLSLELLDPGKDAAGFELLFH
jgi:predicted Zn finger-like uncharacterized protein